LPGATERAVDERYGERAVRSLAIGILVAIREAIGVGFYNALEPKGELCASSCFLHQLLGPDERRWQDPPERPRRPEAARGNLQRPCEHVVDQEEHTELKR